MEFSRITSDEEMRPDEKLCRMTRLRMSETGSDDFDATYRRIIEAYPELHTEWLNSNGVRGRYTEG